MEKAFDIILKALSEELAKQGFSDPEEMEDELGKAYLYKTDAVAYQVVYDDKKQVFRLRSNAYTENGDFAHDWKQLSQWLFDKEEGTDGDAQSIANDFVEVVAGSNRMKAVQSARKKSKKKGDDENNIDTIFFFNRLAGIFPDFRDEMDKERITYGEIRTTVLAKNIVAPMIEELALTKPNSDSFRKVKVLLADMYKGGDADLRSIITAGVLNSISDKAIDKVTEDFEGDIVKIYKCARKLIGKNIKPEKIKTKKKRIAAASLDSQTH